MDIFFFLVSDELNVGLLHFTVTLERNNVKLSVRFSVLSDLLAGHFGIHFGGHFGSHFGSHFAGCLTFRWCTMGGCEGSGNGGMESIKNTTETLQNRYT